MANRNAPRALSKSVSDIAKNAQTEKQRKADSKAALRATLKAQNDAIAFANPTNAERAKATLVVVPKPDHKAEDAANLKAALEVDARAVLGEDATPEAIAAYVAEQSVTTPDAKAYAYNGPMIALRSAAKHYVRGIHCGDWLATAIDGLSREQVVELIGTFLVTQKITTSANPYANLNPGQQSMNLRNKLRGAIAQGTTSVTVFMNAATIYREAHKA